MATRALAAVVVPAVRRVRGRRIYDRVRDLATPTAAADAPRGAFKHGLAWGPSAAGRARRRQHNEGRQWP